MLPKARVRLLLARRRWHAPSWLVARYARTGILPVACRRTETHPAARNDRLTSYDKYPFDPPFSSVFKTPDGEALPTIRAMAATGDKLQGLLHDDSTQSLATKEMKDTEKILTREQLEAAELLYSDWHPGQCELELVTAITGN